jgi:hypothetical protein
MEGENRLKWRKATKMKYKWRWRRNGVVNESYEKYFKIQRKLSYANEK